MEKNNPLLISKKGRKIAVQEKYSSNKLLNVVSINPWRENETIIKAAVEKNSIWPMENNVCFFKCSWNARLQSGPLLVLGMLIGIITQCEANVI